MSKRERVLAGLVAVLLVTTGFLGYWALTKPRDLPPVSELPPVVEGDSGPRAIVVYPGTEVVGGHLRVSGTPGNEAYPVRRLDKTIPSPGHAKDDSDVVAWVEVGERPTPQPFRRDAPARPNLPLEQRSPKEFAYTVRAKILEVWKRPGSGRYVHLRFSTPPRPVSDGDPEHGRYLVFARRGDRVSGGGWEEERDFFVDERLLVSAPEKPTFDCLEESYALGGRCLADLERRCAAPGELQPSYCAERDERYAKLGRWDDAVASALTRLEGAPGMNCATLSGWLDKADRSRIAERLKSLCTRFANQAERCGPELCAKAVLGGIPADAALVDRWRIACEADDLTACDRLVANFPPKYGDFREPTPDSAGTIAAAEKACVKRGPYGGLERASARRDACKIIAPLTRRNAAEFVAEDLAECRQGKHLACVAAAEIAKLGFAVASGPLRRELCEKLKEPSLCQTGFDFTDAKKREETENFCLKPPDWLVPSSSCGHAGDYWLREGDLDRARRYYGRACAFRDRMACREFRKIASTRDLRALAADARKICLESRFGDCCGAVALSAEHDGGRGIDEVLDHVAKTSAQPLPCADVVPKTIADRRLAALGRTTGVECDDVHAPYAARQQACQTVAYAAAAAKDVETKARLYRSACRGYDPTACGALAALGKRDEVKSAALESADGCLAATLENKNGSACCLAATLLKSYAGGARLAEVEAKQKALGVVCYPR